MGEASWEAVWYSRQELMVVREPAHGGGENGENWMTSRAFRQIAKIL